jgi:hypothetical protein
MTQSIYVEFLKWADSKGLEGFSEQDVVERFGEEIQPVLLSAKKSQALVYKDVPGVCQGEYQVLSLDGKFKLLDHQELVEAKAATREAKRQARVAFTLSILSLVAAGLTTYLQLTNPTMINPEQVVEIIDAIRASEPGISPLSHWLNQYISQSWTGTHSGS